MNKTQKGAWLTVGTYVLVIGLLIYVFERMQQLFHQGFMPSSTKYIGLLWGLIIFGWMGGWLVYLRRSQSPKEVEADERDKLIMKRAVVAGFVSVWILLIFSYLILWRLLGLDGAVPVCFLPLIYLAVFTFAMLVYSVAVLMQYWWGGKEKGEQK